MRIASLNSVRTVCATPALEKGLDILELFAHEPDGLTKSEVARRLQQTVSEVFRVLLCLEKRGYIARSEEDGRLRLTLKPFTLCHDYPLTERLVTEAMPIMQDLSNRLKQSCHVGVLADASIMIVAHVDSPVSPALSIKTGSVIDLMHASMGQVFVAHMSDEGRRSVIERWCQQHGSMRSLPADLDAQLAAIRRRGYQEDQSSEVPRSVNVSCPVLDASREVFAVLAVPYLARIDQPVSLDTVRSALQFAAKALGSKLGGASFRRQQLFHCSQSCTDSRIEVRNCPRAADRSG